MITSPPQHITIASRESQLAMWQSRHICSQIASLYPQITLSILGLTTRGDQILDKSLAKIGGKGLFIKELEWALVNNQADLAVHSLKDMPMLIPEDYVIAAISQREDASDSFVSNHFDNLDALPSGSIIGTSSLRRQSQIYARYPHLIIKPLRGNVQTRLKKLDDQEFDGIILATAGLKRLGLENRISQIIPINICLPAAGQGALAIEIAQSRAELIPLLAPLHDNPTAQSVLAERTMAQLLGGSCQIPIAAYAEICEEGLHLRGMVGSLDGKKVCFAEAKGSDPIFLGQTVAESLFQQGAVKLIEAAKEQA